VNAPDFAKLVNNQLDIFYFFNVSEDFYNFKNSQEAAKESRNYSFTNEYGSF